MWSHFSCIYNTTTSSGDIFTNILKTEFFQLSDSFCFVCGIKFGRCRENKRTLSEQDKRISICLTVASKGASQQNKGPETRPVVWSFFRVWDGTLDQKTLFIDGRRAEDRVRWTCVWDSDWVWEWCRSCGRVFVFGSELTQTRFVFGPFWNKRRLGLSSFKAWGTFFFHLLAF